MKVPVLVSVAVRLVLINVPILLIMIVMAIPMRKIRVAAAAVNVLRAPAAIFLMAVLKPRARLVAPAPGSAMWRKLARDQAPLVRLMLF